MDPYLQMLGMVQFYREEESVTPYQAFRCYTAHAAKAIGEEDEYGTLEKGKHWGIAFDAAWKNEENLRDRKMEVCRK